MASAKQIAWRKKFARMSKAGKFKKKKTSTKNPYPKSHPRYEDAKKHPHKYGKHQDAHVAEFDVSAQERSKYVSDVKKRREFQADFDKTYNISALKKRLNEVRKENDTIYIKTGKLDKKLLRETNDILKRLKVASRNPERYGK